MQGVEQIQSIEAVGRERRKQAGDTEIPVYRGPVNSRVPVFAAKTRKYG